MAPDAASARGLGDSTAGTTRTLPSHLKYAKLAADLPPEPKQTPSMLAAELKGHSRPPAALRRPRVVGLLNMSEFTHHTDSIVPLEEPLFQPSPPEVIFDSFEPNGKYTTTLRFRNNDNVNRRLKVLKIDSTAFSFEPPKGSNGSSKVAPGMEVAYKITFTPRADQDYSCELVCLSEREKFVVMISARGPRACFEFPDGVDFGLQPVRANATEAFLLRNTGGADGRFVLSVPAPFSVTPADGALRAGEALQLTFGFQPEARGEYAEEMLIEYDSGERCYARLSGASSDVEVGLERSLLVLEPCYISLLSQTTLKLHNRSDVKVSFSWKANRSTREDDAYRMDALMRLDSEADRIPQMQLRAARRLIEENPLPFDDPIFSIDPPEGEIFPNAYCELTVAFRPTTAGENSVTAYCELTGRESRLPLQLQGQGLGPKATWLYESLDIGDVYVNSEHKYEVVLENHGDIDCDYSLAPNNNLFAKRFTFTPDRGHLKSRKQQVVEVKFCSDLLGELNETFTWYLVGQPEPLPLVLKGRVVGPQFNFSREVIGFGTVSLGFLNATPFFLHNTAEIPMRFRLRIPDGEGNPHPEFEVKPERGIVLPHGKQELKLNFISTAVQKYNLAMLVDVEAVGDSLLSLPITAECIVPAIQPSVYEIDFGDAFVGYTYEQTIKIINPSHLPAKCEVVEEKPMLKAIGEFTTEPARAEIPAHGEIELKVRFTAGRLGQMCLPMYVRIVGLVEPAFTVELNANAIGPNVHLSAPKMDWGKALVLTDVKRSITLTNDSLVPAVYKCLLRKSDSPFTILEPSGTLAPQEVREFAVSAHMDDTVRSTNDLILQIVNAPEVVVPLAATGVGATITTSRSLKDGIDFGENYSSRVIREEFTFENLGRKPQQISWLNLNAQPAPKAKGEGSDEKAPPIPIFSITPDRVIMEPGSVQTFVVRAMSPSAGLKQETLQCSCQVGTGKAFPIFEPVMSATFIDPLVEPSEPDGLDFLYTYAEGDVDKVLPPQTKPLTLTNTSPLPLTLLLKAAPPFAVDIGEVHLPPGEGAKMTISFDVNFPGDKVSRVFNDPASHKLMIAYKEHPQRDGIRLGAETQFPNLVISPTEGAFGCLLNDTQSSLILTLHNPSAVDLHYSWSFAPEDGVGTGPNTPEDPTNTFDILPIRATLKAGQEEEVELLYKGTTHDKKKALALCSVVGGPTYQLPLTAESSDVKYELDTRHLDFGMKPYDRVEELEMFLKNTGRVAINWSVVKDMLSRKNVVEVLPSGGKVPPGERVRLLVRVLPGVPGQLHETFHLQIAHFPLEAIEVEVDGIYPRIALNLPRDKNAEWEAAYAAAKAKVDAEREADEREKLGLPAEDKDAPLVELDADGLCQALGKQTEATLRMLGSWGRADPEAFLSKEEFRVLALSTLEGLATGAAAAATFAHLTAQAYAEMGEGGGEEAETKDNSGEAAEGEAAPPPVAPLQVGVLLKAMKAPKGAAGSADQAADDEIVDIVGGEDETATLGGTATFAPGTSPSRASGGKSPGMRSGFDASMARSSASDPSGRYRVFTDSDVDVEAERTSLETYCRGVLQTHGDAPVDGSPPATARSGMGASLKRGSTAASLRGKLVPTLEPLPAPPPGFTLAKYVLDFGNVIKGNQKKKFFKLKNMGHSPVSLDIDKNQLSAYGFRCEPDKVVKMPGLPEPGQEEFAVTFASKANKVGLGPLVQELRLDMKPGPPVVIIVKANVTVPEVRLNVDALDFGDVIVGRCYTFTVVLHNPKEVVAEWAVKPPIEGGKDFSYFSCSPSSGTLVPNGKLHVEVTFTPTTERAYGTKLNFKCANNNKPYYLTVNGQGRDLKVACVPDAIELPPVMPHADASHMIFELRNPTAYPIEVYSVEYDGKYLDEELMLREDESAPTVHDNLVLPTREPGVTFDEVWGSVKTAYEERKAAEAAQAEAEAKAERARLRAEAGEPPEEEEEEEGAPAAETKDNQEVGEVEGLEEEPSEPIVRSLIVLAPAPLSGSAEIGKKLAFGYQVPLLDLGEVVETAAAEANEAARQARLEAKQAAEAEKAAAREAAIEAGEEPPADEEAAEEEEEAEEVAVLDEEAVAAAIASAVSRDAQPSGCVMIVPEMPARAATTEAIVGALSAALADEPKWAFALDLPPETIEERAAAEHAAFVDALPAVGAIPDVDEAEYDAMDASAREKFERARREHKRLVAAREAKVKAAQIAHRHRVASLVEEHEQFKGRIEEVKGKFEPAPVDPPPPPAEGEEAPPPPVGLPGVWDVDVMVAPPAPPAEGEEGYEEWAAALAAAEEAGEEAPDYLAWSAEQTGEPPFEPSAKPVQALVDEFVSHLPVMPPPIPEVEPDPEIPLPYYRQIMKRPRPRAPGAGKRPIGFRIITLPPDKPLPEPPAEGEEGYDEWAAALAAHAEANPPAEGEEAVQLVYHEWKEAQERAAAEAAGEPIEEPPPDESTRWCLAPKGMEGSSVRLQVDFEFQSVAKLLQSLRFEVTGVGQDRQAGVACTAICARPSISTDPRNVFSRKVKAKDPLKVKKSYVVVRKCFEFGPLLVGRPKPAEASGEDPDAEDYVPAEAPHADHAELLHVSNNSPFPLTVHFSFLAGGAALHTHQPRPFSPPPEPEPELAEGEEAPPPTKEAEEAPPERSADAGPVFFLHETSMTLNPEETRDLRLSAFPDMDGLFEENLVCTVENNPEPVQFPIACIGSTPAVALDTSSVVFERMLLGRSDTKVVTISSRSALPVRWSISPEDLKAIAGAEGDDAEDPPRERAGSEFYTVTPTSGFLAPGEVAHLSVTFHAREPGECLRNFSVSITDAAEPPVLGVVATMPIELQAEAYDIKVSLEWPDKEKDEEGKLIGYEGLDFGSFKVVDQQTFPKEGDATGATLELLNEGKYEVGFKFVFKSKLMKSILTLDPAEGVLEPGAEGAPSRLKITATFKAESEVTFKDNTDVRLRMTEPLTSEILEERTMGISSVIKVSAHAVFSKYVLVPKGINFGPMVYDTTKERTFELTNTGEFDFNFDLRNHADAASGDAKGGAASVQLGRFTVTPGSGTVPAGGIATLNVKFTASPGDPTVAIPEHEVLVVDVADRDASAEPDGVMYELLAESCIPGIETTDFVQIFEEQTVNRTAVLANIGLPTNVFAEDEKLFTFGSHMVGQEVSERYKLTNPFKVPCTVGLSVAARAPKGGAPPAAGSTDLPFDVEPKKLTIPPHEHRYITCFFAPQSMQTYFATLDAEVELGTVPETKKLSFDLMAEGTLPHVSVVKPIARTEEGAPLLHFPRLLVGRTARQQLTLRNEGVLPATVSVSQISSPSPFSCVLCGQSVSLPSMGEQTVDVVFRPLAEGEVSSSIRIQVHQNEYEDVDLMLQAEGHVQEVAFEDLPPPPDANGGAVDVGDGGGADTGGTPPPDEDKLSFGDVEVGVPKALTFTLRNFSATARRFQWQAPAGVTFSPSIGHLAPNGVKSITATFSSAEPLEYGAEAPEQATLSLTKIAFPAYGGKAPPEWDDSMVVVKYLTEAEYLEREAAKAAAAAAAAEAEGGEGAPPADPKSEEAQQDLAQPSESAPPSPGLSPARMGRRKVTDVEPEPEYEEIAVEEGEEPEAPLPLALAAKCQYATLECEPTSLAFKPTMMFQVRSHSFPLVNTSGVALHYRWKVTTPDGSHEPLPLAEAPFAATPAFGVIPANGKVDVSVSFSPAEVETYQRQLRLVCSNLHPDSAAPVISLVGKSVRPYCHFEIAESDYVRAGRRSPDMPGPDGSLGPLDPATKVIEFSSLGTRVRNTKRFYVVNPTNRTYEFFWVPAVDEVGATEALVAQPFRCQTRKGTVLAGRKYEMVFHFTPEEVTLQESHWRFQVPELAIDVPFLLVGTILEPGVSLDRTRHNFGPLLIGQGARETLHIVNTEHLPFSFSFEKSSFATAPGGGESVVNIEPLQGVVGPDSSLPIEVTFTPSLEKHFNFNIELRVRNKPQPLVLNIKGEGYAIHDLLHLSDASGKFVEISPYSPTRVDFGLVHINDKIIRQLQITNSGRFNFDVALNLKVPPGVRMPPVAVTPELATVKRSEKLACQLAYSPTSDAPLPQGLALQVSVTNGRTYTLQLSGKGKKPRLVFSFTKHDFGPCFVVTPKNGMQPVEATLQLVNEDENEVYFDAAFDEVEWLTATVNQTTIAPGEAVSVQLAFAPPASGKFETRLPFLINGLYMQSVLITGEGCDLRLELSDPSQQQLHFGTTQVSQTVTRSVPVANRSRRPVDVSLADAAEKLREKSMILSFAGGGVERTLRPRESVPIELRFVPQSRITPFSEPIVARVCGLPRALIQVNAACVAMDLQLEMEQVSFGQATLHSRITRPLMLQNRGDIPSTWKIDKALLAPDFSVSPLEGYLQPNEDTNIEITFHPQRVNRDIRYEKIPIYVDGQSPIPLTLTGMCVEASAEEAPLVFKTPVRVPMTKSVSIKNPSTGPWTIKPVVQDDQWSGPEVLEVPAGGTGEYVVTYCPMLMTKEDSEGEIMKHQGSVFFPLPDGTAILYSLEGEADPPGPADSISQTLACKSAHIVELDVPNWLKQPQRFRVDIRPGEGTDPSTVLKGHEHVDVPAGQSRTFKLSYFAYKEGTTTAQVHFINDKNGEYLFYNLSLTGGAPGTLDSIAMQAPLRQLTSHLLPLFNPLDAPVTFTASVNNPEVTVKDSIEVPANGKAEFPIEWRPLLPKETTSQLQLNSAELGNFNYDLRLQALPAGETKVMQFKCALGSLQTLRFRFLNFLRKPETYKLTLSAKGDAPVDFECDATINAPAAEGSNGAETAVDVTFEPSSMQSTEALLTIASAEGGEYTCDLKGEALPPRPQGPIAIKANASAQVNFKNVFQSQAEFSFVCDSPAFTVAKPKEAVPPKKPTTIAVAFKPPPEMKAGEKLSGKLTVSTPDGFTQLYYLSGEN